LRNSFLAELRRRLQTAATPAAKAAACLMTVAESHCVQGTPTSPALCNALVMKLDRRIAGLARKFGVNYTRYADDLTFSGPLDHK
jgi:Reverse transcriptase (RNA-dependent DNA polymerase)